MSTSTRLSTVQTPLRGEPYTATLVQRILEHWEHLQSIAEATSFLNNGTCNVDTLQETLWSLYLDVDRGLQKLPLRQRRALQLTLVSGYSQQEAAQALHISRSALRGRIADGLANLTNLLNDCQHPLHARGTLAAFPSSRTDDAWQTRQTRAVS